MECHQRTETMRVELNQQTRKALGQSLWVLLLLRRWVGPSDLYVRSGDSIRARELGEQLGIGERQARRDLQRLREAGFVELENTGRGYRIRVRDEGAA